MAAILKNGRHLKFQVASVFFQKSNPQGLFTPSLVLVSYFERFAEKKHLSAALRMPNQRGFCCSMRRRQRRW